MKRVLTELTPECEVTAQMFISGMEKEEIAEAKCRAFSTINNQLQKAFQILNVKNGRQLCKKFYERLSGVEYTFVFHQLYALLLPLSSMCFRIIALPRTERYEKSQKNENRNR